MEKAFEKSHPIVMLLYFIMSTALVMYINHPLFLTMSFIISMCNSRLFVTNETLLKTVKGSFLLIIFVVVVNIFFNQNGETVIATVLRKDIMLEVVVYSIVMGLMLANILQLSLLFNKTMNGPKLLYIFSKFLPKTGLVTMLALRYVPLLLQQIQEIIGVQKMRGYSVTEGPFLHRIKSGLLFIQLLLSISLEDALQTADSMKVRGYGLVRKRTSYTKYAWSSSDTMTTIFLVTICLFVIVRTLTGAGIIKIYPKLSSFWTNDHIAISSLACLLVSLPLMKQCLEWCRWKFYSLKM